MLKLTLVGGPTALIEYGGLRWLTDPTFSPPGEYDQLTKTSGPALAPAAVEPVDVVLLSHDHHADNLDPAGRELLPRARRVLTTAAGAQRLGGNATGLAPWRTLVLPGAHADVTVTAVPALHGPAGRDRGPVCGFVLSTAGEDTVYVSGDNASLDVVRDVTDGVGPIGVAVLFAGAVQIDSVLDGAYLTLSADRAAQATEILGARAVIPLHLEGWTHVTQGLAQIRSAFAGYELRGKLVAVERGQTVAV